MAAVAPHTIRQRMAAALTANLPDVWRESPYVLPELMYQNQRTSHRSFAVLALRTVPVDRRRRIKTARGEEFGMPSRTTFSVVWRYRIIVDGKIESYDAALASELLVHQALAQMSCEHTGPPVFQEMTRRVLEPETGDSFMELRGTWTVDHLYAVVAFG